MAATSAGLLLDGGAPGAIQSDAQYAGESKIDGRSAAMATAKLSDEALLAVLQAHPGLRARIVSIVSAIENCEGDLKEADAAEERIVEEMRLLGREALQGWAEKQVEVTEGEIRQRPHMHRQGKKKSAGIRSSAKSRS